MNLKQIITSILTMLGVTWMMARVVSGNKTEPLPPTLPVSVFTGTPQMGVEDTVVQFTNLSSGTEPLTYLWGFGGAGSIPMTSTEKNPTVTFHSINPYTISLQVTNAAGSDTETKEDYILITGAPPAATYGAGNCLAATGDPLGGGAGYSRIITQASLGAGDHIVGAATASALISALAAATAGDIVFIPPAYSINLTGTSYITVPAGVTLASDRGNSGSTGALIYRDDVSGWVGTIRPGGNSVRITGLRIRGNHSGYDVEYGSNIRSAISSIDRIGLEVDNCEIWYWSYAAVSLDNTTQVATWTANVHHNYIHNCSGKGYGYGICCVAGVTTITGNYFDYCRHTVIGEGCLNEKFTYTYNSVGSHQINPVLDLHKNCGEFTDGGVSGVEYHVEYNTILYSGSPFMNSYGSPSIGLYINNNMIPAGNYLWVGHGTTPAKFIMTDNMVGGVITATGPIVER